MMSIACPLIRIHSLSLPSLHPFDFPRELYKIRSMIRVVTCFDEEEAASPLELFSMNGSSTRNMLELLMIMMSHHQ